MIILDYFPFSLGKIQKTRDYFLSPILKGCKPNWKKIKIINMNLNEASFLPLLALEPWSRSSWLGWQIFSKSSSTGHFLLILNAHGLMVKEPSTMSTFLNTWPWKYSDSVNFIKKPNVFSPLLLCRIYVSTYPKVNS